MTEEYDNYEEEFTLYMKLYRSEIKHRLIDLTNIGARLHELKGIARVIKDKECLCSMYMNRKIDSAIAFVEQIRDEVLENKELDEKELFDLLMEKKYGKG